MLEGVKGFLEAIQGQFEGVPNVRLAQEFLFPMAVHARAQADQASPGRRGAPEYCVSARHDR